uniref:Uncharacterized protein n=1 Tax=Arundo donax TaxID=35708 RepID=A0A0A9BLE1_ARUDO
MQVRSERQQNLT